MRMDNETYRLKVEGLLSELRRDGNNLNSEVAKELEALALTPRKARHFLRALLTTGQDHAVQVHFYRLVLEAARTKDAYSDLERHIRHAFYEAREETKAVLAEMNTRAALLALFHVIALTEEGWLAGELIRIVLSMSPRDLEEPLREALHSKDYLLQCLAIYLIGKTADEELLHMLAAFYRKPVGDADRLERLEKKSYDALVEGAEKAPASLFSTWLKDRSSRVRALAVTVLAAREVPEAVLGLAGLILIDAKTRNRAAQVLLRYAENDVFRWDPDDPQAAAIAEMLARAKEPALSKLVETLMRDESPDVRQVAIYFVGLMPSPSDHLLGQVRRLAIEDPLPAVQMAALRVLERIDVDRLVPCLVEVYADNGFGQGSPELLELANQIMQRSLAPHQIMKVQEGIKIKKERRAAALERFTATVEWWRHEE